MAAITPGKRPGAYCTGGCVGPKAGFEWWKISLTPGYDPRTFQPIVRRYTEYAVAAHTEVCVYVRKVMLDVSSDNILSEGSMYITA